MSSWSGSAAVVGVHEDPIRRDADIHPREIEARAILAALADAGLTLADVDGLAVSASAAEPAEAAGMSPVVDMAEYLGLAPRYLDSTDLGGAGPLAQVARAAAAIHAGEAEVVVVSYAANPFLNGLNPPPPELTGPMQFEAPYGLTTVARYALAAQRHMAQFGTTPDQLAEIAVTCRAHAANNPHARYRNPLTVQDVLDSPMIASPLRRFDCCVVTTGGGAVVVTSARRARDCPRPPALLLGAGQAVSHTLMAEMDDFTISPAAASGPPAFAQAGVAPSDIDVAQLYDSFTITTLLALEDLGFCEKGEGGKFVTGGNLTIGGALPINTDGGGLSSNHPGRRGIFTIIEAVRQLRGSGVGVQVPDARLALAHGSGGQLSTAATLILGRE